MFPAYALLAAASFSGVHLSGFSVGGGGVTPSGTPSACASDSIFFAGFEPALPIEVTGSGVGSSDNYTVYVAGSGFANDSYVEVRAHGSSTLLGTYTGCSRTLTNRNGLSILTFRVTDATQQGYLNGVGLDFTVVNPSASTSAGPTLVQRTKSSVTSLTISGAGTGGPDHLSAYVIGTLFDPNASIDARYDPGSSIIHSYFAPERSYDAEYGIDIMTMPVTDSQQQSPMSRNGLYLWVVNTSTFTGPAIAKRGNAQVKGGSNYNWWRVDFNAGNTCNREDYGIIVNYDQSGVRAAVQSQLATMFAAGQRRLRVGLYFSDTATTGTVAYAPSGTFPSQYLTNLQTYLADIKAAGFQEVDLSMFPLGGYDFYGASSFSQTIADHYWSLVQQAQTAITNSGLHYLVDLGNEHMPPVGASSAWNSYTTSIWNRYVAAYGPHYTVGFSAIDAGPIDNMSIYGATPPDVVDIHVYSSASSMYNAADDSLTNQGLTNTDIVIAEAWYNDSTYASGIRSSVNASSSGRWMRWLTEWPRSQSGLQTPSCTGDNVAPPLDDSTYQAQGF